MDKTLGEKKKRRFWTFNFRKKLPKEHQEDIKEHQEDIVEQESASEKSGHTELATVSSEKKEIVLPVETSLLDPSDRVLSKMRSGLKKTRQSFWGKITSLLSGKEINQELLDELEMQLITADVGVDASSEIIQSMIAKAEKKELSDEKTLFLNLKEQLISLIQASDKPLIVDSSKMPYVILVVGVNGVGKTTTIGKIAYHLRQQKKKVMLAAGDTFRAAAVEQLQEWGRRIDIPVISPDHDKKESASVIYEAYAQARTKKYDVLIADTAGRLHNQSQLMDELKKIKRVLGRLDHSSPHEVMLIVDAGTGQNTINQALLFNEAVQITGMTLTKLDGTAKGGVIFALAKKMQVPIRFVGLGEKYSDLRPFSSRDFVEALFEPGGY